MTDTQNIDASFGVRYVADELTPQEAASLNPRELGAGYFEFGATVEGAWVPLLVRKAGNIQKRIDAAKNEAESGGGNTTAAPQPTDGGGGLEPASGGGQG